MIGSLGFLSPWLLVALAALPLIWLILRLTPPRPRQLAFPPTRILLGLDDRERTPARTPPWPVEVTRARLPGPGISRKTMTATTKDG